jgi:hypothetical protein
MTTQAGSPVHLENTMRLILPFPVGLARHVRLGQNRFTITVKVRGLATATADGGRGHTSVNGIHARIRESH